MPLPEENRIGTSVTHADIKRFLCDERIAADWKAITKDGDRLDDLLDFLATYKETFHA